MPRLHPSHYADTELAQINSSIFGAEPAPGSVAEKRAQYGIDPEHYGTPLTAADQLRIAVVAADVSKVWNLLHKRSPAQELEDPIRQEVYQDAMLAAIEPSTKLYETAVFKQKGRDFAFGEFAVYSDQTINNGSRLSYHKRRIVDLLAPRTNLFVPSDNIDGYHGVTLETGLCVADRALTFSSVEAYQFEHTARAALVLHALNQNPNWRPNILRAIKHSHIEPVALPGHLDHVFQSVAVRLCGPNNRADKLGREVQQKLSERPRTVVSPPAPINWWLERSKGNFYRNALG